MYISQSLLLLLLRALLKNTHSGKKSNKGGATVGGETCLKRRSGLLYNQINRCFLPRLVLKAASRIFRCPGPVSVSVPQWDSVEPHPASSHPFRKLQSSLEVSSPQLLLSLNPPNSCIWCFFSLRPPPIPLFETRLKVRNGKFDIRGDVPSRGAPCQV